MEPTDLAQMLREGHAAFNKRDQDGLMAMMGENVVWHSPGDSPLGGTYNGREELWKSFFALMWGSPMKVEDREISGTDEHAVAIFDLVVADRRWKAVEIIHVTDGKVAERWSFLDRQAEFDQFMQQMG